MKVDYSYIFNNKIIISIGTILLTVIVGVADIVTTSQYRLYSFYVVPIILAAFFFHPWYSILLSSISTLFILASKYIDIHSLRAGNYWNAAMMMFVFLSIVFLAKLLGKKKNIENEKVFFEEKSGLLADALREKELLIREMYHRTKNHLSALASLINLSRAADSDALISRLNARIQTFTLIYNKLSYTDNSSSKIILCDYIRELIRLIIESFGMPPDSVGCTVTGGDIRATARSVSLLGMIINELVSNSIKHAFKGKQNEKNKINVNCELRENRLVITYSDNGPGFRYDDLGMTGGHLGVHIIDSLSKQLGGEVNFDPARPSEFTLVFNDAERIIDQK